MSSGKTAPGFGLHCRNILIESDRACLEHLAKFFRISPNERCHAQKTTTPIFLGLCAILLKPYSPASWNVAS